MSKIEIIETRHVTKQGKPFFRFTPTLKTDCLASGSLTFACFDAFQHEVSEVRRRALHSAQAALIIITQEATQP
jgi:hypothetical protein